MGYHPHCVSDLHAVWEYKYVGNACVILTFGHQKETLKALVGFICLEVLEIFFWI